MIMKGFIYFQGLKDKKEVISLELFLPCLKICVQKINSNTLHEKLKYFYF